MVSHKRLLYWTPKNCSFAKLMLFSALTLLLFASACKNKPVEPIEQDAGFRTYHNEIKGFSVSYPARWDDTTEKQPDRWALVDQNKNAVLFFAMAIPLESSVPKLMMEEMATDLGTDIPDISELDGYLTYNELNNHSWYSYGLKRRDNLLETLSAGTQCGNNMVNIRLVSRPEDINLTKQEYTGIIQSFECELR
ncbi:hypothetical protein J4227_08000 [Candidatus Woesearchaeota archaeon]|nr:hypothetical protein [Candidatus Woesearchaeota archaeon]